MTLPQDLPERIRASLASPTVPNVTMDYQLWDTLLESTQGSFVEAPKVITKALNVGGSSLRSSVKEDTFKFIKREDRYLALELALCSRANPTMRH